MRRKIYKAEDGGNADPIKGQLSDNGEAFGRSAGWQAAGSIATAIGQAFRPTNSADQTASAIGQGIGDVVSQIHPIAAVAVAAGRIMDSALGNSGWKAVDKDAAKAAGANVGFENVLASIPGNSIWGLAMKKSNKATDFSDRYSEMGEFEGFMSRANNAQKLSGVKTLHTGKFNQYIQSSNAIGQQVTRTLDFNKKRRNNQASEDYFQMNQQRFSGANSTLNLKNGAKFPELGEARELLRSLKENKVAKHQSGGVIQQNIIPDGALHKNKHHIEEVNPELEGQITKKGIPVVSMDEGGEISQSAEIEAGELTMEISASKQLETFYEQYNQAEGKDKDAIAVECGKFIAEEILRNTQDNVGLIKEVKV